MDHSNRLHAARVQYVAAGYDARPTQAELADAALAYNSWDRWGASSLRSANVAPHDVAVDPLLTARGIVLDRFDVDHGPVLEWHVRQDGLDPDDNHSASAPDNLAGALFSVAESMPSLDGLQSW